MIVKFNKPYTFESKEYTEIEIDIENLTILDFKELIKEFNKTSSDKVLALGAMATNDSFIIWLLAKCSKKPIEFYQSMKINTYFECYKEVINFLAGSD